MQVAAVSFAIPKKAQTGTFQTEIGELSAHRVHGQGGLNLAPEKDLSQEQSAFFTPPRERTCTVIPFKNTQLQFRSVLRTKAPLAFETGEWFGEVLIGFGHG